MKVKIFSVFVESAYQQVHGEDGSYDAVCGANVLATTKAVDKVVLTYCHKLTLPTVADAQKLADKIREAGEINEDHWDVLSVRRTDELPDYVTHWYRPEYN